MYVAYMYMQNFLVTPHTQESYRKIDEEFDTLLRQNQIPQQPVQAHGIQVNSLDTSPPLVNFHLRGVSHSPPPSYSLMVAHH